MNSYTAVSMLVRRGPYRAIGAIAYCACLSGLAPHGYSVELIRNGSFEENRFTGFPRSEGWDDGPGIDSDIGFVVREYPFGGPIPDGCGNEWCNTAPQYVSPGPPISGVSGPVGRGRFYASNFGRGNGGGGIEGSATQHIDLAGHADSLFDFSAWFASDIDTTDYSIVTLEFFSSANATGLSVGVIELVGNDQQSTLIIGSANQQGIADPEVPATQDNWTFYLGNGRIPLNAVSAAVVLRDLGIFGTGGYVDLVSLQVTSEAASVPGDYNGNDKVEQGDLDLVLLNWGADSIVAPDGWIRDLPTGAVDQAELDAVLLNWGNTQPPVNRVGAIPEPATMSLVLAVLPLVVALRRTHAKRRNSIVGEEKSSKGDGGHYEERPPSPFGSSHYTDTRIKNWLFNTGLESGTEYSS